MFVNSDFSDLLRLLGEQPDMRDYFISIFHSDEDGGYIADIPDLRYCSAFGNTPDEALREVQIAKQAWLEAAMAAASRSLSRATDLLSTNLQPDGSLL